MDISEILYSQVKELFPICRSLTGQGNRDTLAYLKKLVPELEIHAVPSGTTAFDWTIPEEWNVRDAYIADETGRRIIDFKKNNLHLLGYSVPVNQRMTFRELEKNLHSMPELREAIPYVTSYYNRRWGFCLSEVELEKLRAAGPDAQYHVVIDSTLSPGHLNYGEIILPGETKEEILLSTYVCHPSMANNELSGPVVAINLARWLKEQPRRYTYRVLFLAETIGSIYYLSKNLKHLQENVKAGFVLTCMGDNRTYSYVPSRNGDTLADRAALKALKESGLKFDKYSFLDRGSDERQYCYPGVDLPVCSVMRSKYGTYPEYHTSLDNLELVSPSGLLGGYEILKKILTFLEENKVYSNTKLCEPQLGKYGLYPAFTNASTINRIRDIKVLLAYADGKSDLMSISETTGTSMDKLIESAKMLVEKELLIAPH